MPPVSIDCVETIDAVATRNERDVSSVRRPCVHAVIPGRACKVCPPPVGDPHNAHVVVFTARDLKGDARRIWCPSRHILGYASPNGQSCQTSPIRTHNIKILSTITIR